MVAQRPRRRQRPQNKTILALAVFAGCAFFAGVAYAQAIERAMTVSVVDDNGAVVRDAGPADFIVREDNVSREILRVMPASEPMDIALLVDTSYASRNNISHFRSALPGFVTQLTNPNAAGLKNRVAIIAMGERPTLITDFTQSAIELTKGINRLWSLQDTGAYFLDSILEACERFKKIESKRPVIVAITQEGREFSYRQYDQVLPVLRASGAALHAIALGSPADMSTDEARSRHIVLDQGTRDTGGRRTQLLTPMALVGSLRQLGDELTHQYLVVYAHPDSLIPPDRVTVESKKPGATARGVLVKDKIPQGRP